MDDTAQHCWRPLGWTCAISFAVLSKASKNYLFDASQEEKAGSNHLCETSWSMSQRNSESEFKNCLLVLVAFDSNPSHALIFTMASQAICVDVISIQAKRFLGLQMPLGDFSQLIGMRNRWSRSNGFNSKWNEARHIVQSHYLCPIWSSLFESLYSGRAHPPVLFCILICSQLLQLRTTENWERFLSLFSNWTRYRAWRQPGRHLSTWFPSTLGLNMFKHILINIW